MLPLGLGVTDPFIVVTQQLGCHLHAVGWQLVSRGRANMLCSRSSREDLSVVFALPFPVFGNSRCVQEAQKLAWKGKSVAWCVTIGLLLRIIIIIIKMSIPPKNSMKGEKSG